MPLRSPENLPWGTLRLRLAAWNTAVVLAMTIATLAAARIAAHATLYEDMDQELRGGAREVTLALQELFPDMEGVKAELRRKAASHEERGWFTQLLTADGVNVWTSEHCPDVVASFPPANLAREENVVQVGPYRYVRLRIDQPGQPAFHVRVGAHTTGLDQRLAGLLRGLIAFGSVLCALTPLVGWWLAVRSTRPVALMLETADRLEPRRLGDRLAVSGSGDELDRLAQTINGLLDDVAAHVDRQQQFVADAAHELRSPLAALQGALEVALSKERAAADYREALEDVLQEARYLSKLTNDLLVLAESSADEVPTHTIQVDLVGLVRQGVAMFAGVAEDRGISLLATLPPAAAIVPADTSQVRQLLANLIDNALRFTPSGGSVEITVGGDKGAGPVTVTVADSGPGIAAEHLPRLFDRFYKIDSSRSRKGGSRSGGLGLAICKAIVERHGGSIQVASETGRGTTITIRLPRLPQATESAAAMPVGAPAA